MRRVVVLGAIACAALAVARLACRRDQRVQGAPGCVPVGRPVGAGDDGWHGVPARLPEALHRRRGSTPS